MSRSPVAFGPYIITRRIARGGMAKIYRARTRTTDDSPAEWVALKMMRPALGHEELREQLFKREARIAAAIDHANVLVQYEFGRELDRYYIAMEYVRGRDLSHLIKIRDDDDRVPYDLGLLIGLRAAAGLGHAHGLTDERGENLQIVHRDISPGNVMVGYDGSVRVLDFGVARINESQGLRTQTGTLRGKFAYMAPEQTLGLPVNSRSDVFSLGTLIYELLTGTNPFRDTSPVDTLERVQRVRPQPPSRVNRRIPKAVDKILARCLAKDPARRFKDGTEIHEAIGDFLAGQTRVDERRLARFMARRFEWEKAEEEKELAQEEEDVALIEVVEFALGADGDDLDAPNVVAVEDEQEASQADVSRGGWESADEAKLGVFDDETNEATIAARIDSVDDFPLDDLSESEATVHHESPAIERMRQELADAARREDVVEAPPTPSKRTPAWVSEGGSREVQASSLLAGPVVREPVDEDNVTRRNDVAQLTAIDPAEVPEIETARPRKAPAPLWTNRGVQAGIAVMLMGLVFVGYAVGSGPDPEPKKVVIEGRPVPAPSPTKIDPVTIKIAPEPPGSAPPPPGENPAPVRKKRRTPKRRTPKKAIARTKKPKRRPERTKTTSRKPLVSKKSKRVGYLNVGAKPWAQINIDGKRWPYQTPQAGIELTEGPHRITLFNPDTRVKKSKTVTIKAGAYKTVTMDLNRR